jgi:two-component system, OmpR family, sensor kinase
MASLRARVLASVLVLAAAGLVLLGGVTYTEQRSFLEGRVDEQVRAAGPAVSQALDKAGFKPDEDSSSPSGKRANNQGGGGPSGRSPNLNLPPGTYGQRRNAGDEVIGNVPFTYGQTAPAPPKLPKHVPLGRIFTVASTGSSGLRYRVYASRDPEDPGITLVAVPLSEVKQTLNRLLLVEALVIIGVLAALGITAFFVVRLGLRPLDRMEVTAGEIAAGELSRRVSPANAKTEVGRLGLALNGMLDRLEQAFADRQASEDRLRQFLADASHELRTPLASIRGYAELFRMGATGDRAGTEMAMRRIEDESKRMGVLVEDLLTLARLDEAPELRRQAVDLVVLAQDAVHDARATAPDRAIDVSAPAQAIVSGDSHQLRQVLANLTRNALVHTPPGTSLELTVQDGSEVVTITVRDHGPGLPDTSQEKLFGRFWRSEGGRERGKAGAGLGLAIVRGLVEAHHGRISAHNAPGGGAAFIVTLPKAHPEPTPARAPDL